MVSRLKWLTFLSLDAPLVAVAWQAMLAHESSFKLHWHHTLIVFMSVWLGYAADRWFDNLKSNRPSSEQHQFYAKHSLKVLFCWLVILPSSVALAFTQLDANELRGGFVLMGLSICYTFFAQKARYLKLYPLLKSLFTAFLVLASAALFVPFTELPLIPTTCIWLLFTSNCLYIRSWTRPAEKAADTLTKVFAIAAASSAVFTVWTQSSTIGIAVLLSQASIVTLHLIRHKVDVPTLRTSADLCLLSPLLFLFP